MDARLSHPFRMVISGVSGSGKSKWVANLLQNHELMITPKINRVIYYYQVFQDDFYHLRNNGIVDEFIKGIPDEETFQRKSRIGPTLFVIDDAMAEKNVDKKMDKIYTISRHMDASIIFLSQNFFHNNMRTISRNSCYFVFMENERDQGQMSTLAHQLDRKVLVPAYKDATRTPFSYLFIDIKPGRNKKLGLRARIFPHEAPMVVYQSVT